MHAKSLTIVCAISLVLANSPRCTAQEGQSSSPAAGSGASRPQDEKAIEETSLALAKSFATGDAKAVATLFTEDAEYLDDEGQTLHGRETLGKAYTELFAKLKNVKAESKTDAVRFLSRDTAIEEGTFTVTTQDRPANASRFSALYVRQDGKWLIALLKEWGDATTGQPKLDNLAWLIGAWESSGEEATARTTYSWAPNKTFIRADFTISPKKGEKPTSGTQVIGIDPAVGQIRAWLFAADGGIGESTWVWDGDQWMIESVGTLSDGTPTSAVNFLARSGDDAFTWRSVGRTLAGEADADTAPVTVKRVVVGGAAPTAPAN